MEIFGLNNKTILITGASSGIGKAMAIACAQAGAKCIISGRNIERLNATLNDLVGDDHQAIAADLTIEDDIQLLINALPKIDGFLSNAGIADSNPGTETLQVVYSYPMW